MQRAVLFRGTLLAACLIGALGRGIHPAEAFYVQTNLISDIAGLAIITDPVLKNSWGISSGPTTPFWVSDQGTNLTTLYVVNSGGVSKNAGLPQVAIPTTPSGPQGPTGQVSNIGGGNFVVSGSPARFIFANLNGTISAWVPALGTTAAIQATTPGAVYTGLAISSGKDRLYAANTAGGRIDVFDSSFAPANLGASAFANPFPGLVPFNVQQIGGKIYVTYAVPGLAAMRAAAEGSGAVAVFDENGALQQKLINGSKLASPWGLALAPAGFGQFGGDLLV
ncbi:MAG: TIGR03118 family protein, partial [Alphaproteobacteria bacterium]